VHVRRAVVDAAGRRLGFEVLGRLEGAEARGCSIASDAMLAAGAAAATGERA